LATPPLPVAVSIERGGENEIGAISGPVVVRLTSTARPVYDYRIISGPTDEATRAQVENLLLFSVYERHESSQARARFDGGFVQRVSVRGRTGCALLVDLE